MNEYEKQATDFLEKHGITFTVVLIGDDCPPFCADARAGKDMDKVCSFPRRSHIHGKHYRAEFKEGVSHIYRRSTPSFVIDFWNSYADEEENAFAFGKIEGTWITGRDNVHWDKYRIGGKYNAMPRAKKRIIPTSYDVLTCITKDSPGTFEEFCGNYGYDTDSRRGEDTYRAVCSEWSKVQRFFTSTEIDELQEIS